MISPGLNDHGQYGGGSSAHSLGGEIQVVQAESFPWPYNGCFLSDGELYTGTVSKFQGNEPTILRSLGSRPPIKTESSLNWLQGV